jgi:hypothetical protein
MFLESTSELEEIAEMNKVHNTKKPDPGGVGLKNLTM